jgi:cytidyltransferase-like protein
MTMTADVLHRGHLHIINVAASLCHYLMIGLTTDEIATRQKRVPFNDFSHRKAMLEGLRGVSAVVPHNGESKEDAYQKLGFDVLFMGDDHRYNPEYVQFQRNYPLVRVFCITRLAGLSSTAMINNFESRVLGHLSVLALGINGPILKHTREGGQVDVIKPIHFGYDEACATDGSDVYKISYPLPRNWKGDKTLAVVWPMIAGVNSWREIIVCRQLREAKKQWCPFKSSRCVSQVSGDKGCEELTNVERVVHQRRYPSQVHWLTSRYCGDSLQWLLQHGRLQVPLDSIHKQVRKIIRELQELGILHGDIHPGNICVDPVSGLVSLIDYGWSLSSECGLTDQEQVYLNDCIRDDFDWKHYQRSLE